MGKGFEQRLLQRYRNGQQAMKKMFIIIGDQRNANQNHSAIPLHSHYNGYNKKRQSSSFSKG